MSSLVSLRSYQRRRKSAGARLEGTHSHSHSHIATGMPSGSPMTPAGPGGDPFTPKQMPVITEFREKRVKSARETRREQEASDIFPELQKGKVDPEWGKTKYSEDFGPKKIVSPVHVRPISPTRMNNPHPSKEFIQWKFPTRIHEHKKATQPPSDILRYLYERFYEDYMDTYNTGDAKNEVAITNLAKIEFPGSMDDPERTASISGVLGKKAQLNPRQTLMNNNDDHQEEKLLLRPPSPQSVMIHHSMKGNTLPLFKKWLKVATDKERYVILQMLQATHDNSEDKRLSRVVNDVLQPDSAERVQEWLKNTNDAERQIALHVLETLAVATGEGDVYAMTHPALYPHIHHRHLHHRHHTFPMSLRNNCHSGSHSSQHRTKGHHCSKCSHRHHHHHHHHHASHSSSVNKLSDMKPGSDSHSNMKPGSDSHSAMGLVGKKIAKPEKMYDENPELWQNRILRKKLGTKKVHPAGVFNQPQKDPGQHFAIHPEWPTA